MAEEEKVVANDETKQEAKAEGKKKKSIFKKWWFWVIIGVVVIAIIVGSSVGSGNDNNSGNGGGNNKTSYVMNQNVVVNDLEYTVVRAYNTKVISQYADSGKTDNNFVVITVKIKNNSSSEKYIGESNLTYYVGNNKYKPHNAGIYLDNGFWLNKTVGAGITITFDIVYEIPGEYKETDYLQVKDSYKTEKIYMK